MFLKLRPFVLVTINGLAWPHTERLTYDISEIVRWRVINLSTQPHPMHLHGFYFDILRQGDGLRDDALTGEHRLRVVTHLLPPGKTLSLVWTPERAGQWLFHCHTMLHVSPTLHVDGSPRAGEAHDHGDDIGMGMTGLVMGILVHGSDVPIHWHGIELESYYDGVHGWSGTPGRLAQSVEPGTSFVVRFTPPRAGTFIYHTHVHDNRQLSGLYGALLVVDPDQPYDETVDHVLVIGRGGPALDAPVVINGQRAPQFVWRSHRRHRIRFINSTPNDTVVATLRTGLGRVAWRLRAKDGASLAAEPLVEVTAEQTIGVGETYDFEFDASAGRQSLWLELRSPGGRWYAQGQVIVQ